MSDMKFGIDIVRYRRIIKKKLLLKSWRIRKIDVYMDFFYLLHARGIFSRKDRMGLHWKLHIAVVATFEWTQGYVVVLSTMQRES